MKNEINLPLGTKIFWDVANSRKEGAIMSIEHICNKIANIVWLDGSGFSRIELYAIEPQSKESRNGFYYFDPIEFVDSSTMQEAIEKSNLTKEKEREEQEQKEVADQKEIEELPNKYPHLAKIDNLFSKESRKITKKNIVAELKKHFPQTKFSVKMEASIFCIDIYWIDGVTESEVAKITNKFEIARSSACGDYYDYFANNFNKVFGGFKFVSLFRKQSEQVKKFMLERASKIGGLQDFQIQNKAYEFFSETSFPAKWDGLEINDNFEIVII